MSENNIHSKIEDNTINSQSTLIEDNNSSQIEAKPTSEPIFSSKFNADKLRNEISKIYNSVDSHAMNLQSNYGNLSSKCLPNLLNYKKILYSIGSSNDIEEIEILNQVAKDMLFSYTKCYKKIYSEKHKL